MLGGEASVGSGGKGGNQAVAAALLGARTSLVARVGQDADGDALLEDLRAASVDTSGVATTTARTGMAFVLVDAAGENAIVVAPGANDAVDPEAVELSLPDLLGPSTVVVTQAEIPLAALESTLRVGSRAGCRVVLNLAPYRAVPDDVLRLCDPLVVNEHEAAELVGRDVEGRAQAETATLELAARTRSVVVTARRRGGRGLHPTARSSTCRRRRSTRSTRQEPGTPSPVRWRRR